MSRLVRLVSVIAGVVVLAALAAQMTLAQNFEPHCVSSVGTGTDMPRVFVGDPWLIQATDQSGAIIAEHAASSGFSDAAGFVRNLCGGGTVYQVNLASLRAWTGGDVTVACLTSGGGVSASTVQRVSRSGNVVSFETAQGGTCGIFNLKPYALVADTSTLTLRSAATSSSTRLAILDEGTRVFMLGRVGNSSWVKVALVDGTEGWLFSRFLNPSVSLSTLPVVRP